VESKQFYDLVDNCRKILTRNLEAKNSNLRFDFDSKIYCDGIRKDLLLVKQYMNNGKVLDVGCGKGHISALLSAMGFDVIGIDLNYSQGEGGIFSGDHLGRQWQRSIWQDFEKDFNVTYKFYDGIKLPFQEESFDAVVAYAVIEHVDDANNLLEESRRVLRDNGRIFIFRCPKIYSFSENLAKLMGLGHHEKLMSEDELTELLYKNMFEVLRIDKYDMIPAFMPIIKLQETWNSLFPMMNVLQDVLLKTPLNFFAHNIRLVAQKQGDRV